MRGYFLILVAVAASLWPMRGADVVSVHYSGAKETGKLPYDSSFHVWISPETKTVRAVIVHQHGCGDGAENSGETAALDLHWRALAKKHDAALLSPHYRAREGECRLWCDPRNGSGDIYLQALHDLALLTDHPELESAPWCLWGHSGGGFWASLMLEKYPNRILGIFCRSGTAADAWIKGEIKKPVYPPAAYRVPIILNPGLKERNDTRFNGAWVASTQFFQMFRSRGAPVALAPDPVSSHDCRNSRLLAIPFFDACLHQRLPMRAGQPKNVVMEKGWIGDWTNGEIHDAERNGADERVEASWLLDPITARAFSEYVRFGLTTDATAPDRSPAIVRVARGPKEGEITLEWTAEADLESGIKQFAIYRNGVRIALYPEESLDLRQGFPQFQGISYHDTPLPGSPRKMIYTDTPPTLGAKLNYSVATVNGPGLESERSKEASP